MQFTQSYIVFCLFAAVKPFVLAPGRTAELSTHTLVDTKGICGQQAFKSSRILGGDEALPHEFPWQAALTIDNLFFCGGSLISSEWVLTAAHCVDGGQEVRVLLGAHDRIVSEPSQREFLSNEYVIHPAWSTATLQNDIALVKLPEPVTFTVEIAPVCVAPTTEPSHEGDELLATGWGWLSEGEQTFAATLHKVIAPGISVSQCTATFGQLVSEASLCIDTTGPKGPCTGDSGGPLTFYNNGVHQLVGVGSFGSSRGCDYGFPFVFTRVSSYTAWISSVTGLVV